MLGIDPGIKRTGLAVSDPLGISVRALETLAPKSRAEDVAHVIALCRELEVEALVVGHPRLPKSGDEGGMARRARGFAQAIHAALCDAGLPSAVHLVDEGGTSIAASSRLVASGVRKSRRKAALDSEAARLLVEMFLGGDDGEVVQSG